MLTRPPWVEFDEPARRQIRYVWDDTRVPRDFRGEIGRASCRERVCMLV